MSNRQLEWSPLSNQRGRVQKYDPMQRVPRLQAQHQLSPKPSPQLGPIRSKRQESPPKKNKPSPQNCGRSPNFRWHEALSWIDTKILGRLVYTSPLPVHSSQVYYSIRKPKCQKTFTLLPPNPSPWATQTRWQIRSPTPFWTQC